RPDVAELGSGLDHLRQAELRALRGVERHEAGAEQRAGDDGDQRPDEVAAADHRERADGERGDLGVAHEPQRSLAPDLAVPLGERHVVDGADLDTGDGRHAEPPITEMSSYATCAAAMPVIS